jgi:hypothetical protein
LCLIYLLGFRWWGGQEIASMCRFDLKHESESDKVR